LQMFFIFMEKQKNQTLVCFSSILIKVARASKKNRPGSKMTIFWVS